MATPSLKQFDITLEDTSAATPKIGLMLLRQNGQRGFSIQDIETPVPRKLTWTQEDWRGGLGGRIDRLDPKRYASAVKIDATQEGVLQLARDLIVTTDDFAPTAYKPGGFAIVGTEIWSFQERDVYSLTYATNVWVKGTAPQAVAVIYRNGVTYGANTYVPAWLTADDTPGTYIYKADADANWTLSTLATKTFKYFVKSRNASGTEILIGGNAGGANAHKIYSTTDPTNAGSWTLLATIGNSDSEITGLSSDGNTVLVQKTNGVWAYYADGSTKNLTSDSEMADPDNFRGSYNWHGHLLMPMGSGGMRELTAEGVFDVSMKDRYAPDQTNLHGRVLAISGDETRLFILVLDTTNTKYHLLMATWDEFQGAQDYRWHHVGSITYTTSTVANHATLFAEGIPSGSTLHHRIWVGVESGGSNLLPYFYPLPDPNDTNLVFTDDDDGELVTTLWDVNPAREPVLESTIDFITANLGSAGTAHYVEVKYRVDGSSWTYVTGVQATSTLTTTPQTLTFASEINGETLELQFLFFQGTTTTTGPQIKKFTVTMSLRPAPIKQVNIQGRIGVGMIGRNGSIVSNAAALAQLISWDGAAPDVTLRYPDQTAAGASLACVIVPGTFKYQEVAVVGKRRIEYVVSFALTAKP